MTPWSVRQWSSALLMHQNTDPNPELLLGRSQLGSRNWPYRQVPGNADAVSPSNLENLSGEAKNTEKDEEIKKRR